MDKAHAAGLARRFANYPIHEEFCRDLSRCPHGHTVRRDDRAYIIFCFAEAAHADLFRERFGGEPFDPKDRGRGRRWHEWRKPRAKRASR